MRANQFDSVFRKPRSQWVGIGCTIVDQSLDSPHRLDRRLGKCRLDEFDFARGRRGELNSQRKTLAVRHHHKLRPLSTLGLADSVSPFFAGENVPSAKTSAQLIRPSSSSSVRNARQIVSQISASSQSRNRLQQVAGEGNRSGKSLHRAPDLSIQRIPSRTSRVSAGGRPPLGFLFGLGSRGSIFCHWASVKIRSCRDTCLPPRGALSRHKDAHFSDLGKTRF